VDFAQYIESLVEDLLCLYNVDSYPVKLNLSIDNLMLDLNTSLFCGLIINELLKNYLKNANLKENCKININFHLNNENFILTVSDDCNIYPQCFDLEYSSFQLVNKLIKQLNGYIIIDKNEESKIKIIFEKLESISV
jgi:two-component sensor histidine kinase